MVYLYDTIIRPIFQTANIIIDIPYTAPPCLGIVDYGRHSMLHCKTSLLVHCHCVQKIEKGTLEAPQRADTDAQGQSLV